MEKGFTLVELAIVITIIGLLIGGVLKGQELLENARMTSGASQLKAFDTAALTFRDIYKAWPGDMKDPTNFLQNCTGAPCNVSGDANGTIGGDAAWGDNEQNNFWLHLAKAGLVSGIDPNATWTSGAFFVNTMPQPNFPLGGKITIVGFFTVNLFAIRDGGAGYYWHGFTRGTDTAGAVSLANNKIGKFDLKIDDGKPKTGSVILYGTAAMASDNQSYDPNNSTLTYLLVKAGF